MSEPLGIPLATSLARRDEGMHCVLNKHKQTCVHTLQQFSSDATINTKSVSVLWFKLSEFIGNGFKLAHRFDTNFSFTKKLYLIVMIAKSYEFALCYS